MKKIILISCASKKLSYKAKAQDLYTSSLFKYSLAYAKSLNPDNIYILSALHHLLELDEEIEPYNVTLCYVSPKKRQTNPNLKVLTTKEKKNWGQRIIQQLSTKTNLKEDQFIILAGQEYIKPIRISLKHIDEPLKGFRQGERVKQLKKFLA